MTLRQFCERYRKGDFNSSDRPTQIEAGWADWFCEDSELADRLSEIWQILKEVKSDYILDNFAVQFTNCCPASDDPLYDSVMFIPINNDNDWLFDIAIGDARRDYEYEILTSRNYYEPEARFNDIREVVAFINDWENIASDESFYIKRAQKDEVLKKTIDKMLQVLHKADLLLLDAKENLENDTDD